MSYVYIRTEPGLWTVGHYDGDGGWEPESDHGSESEAAARVVTLNGGGHDLDEVTELREEVAALRKEVASLWSRIQEMPSAIFERSL